MIEEDPILGPVRYCRGCDEWWPDDAEFWYTTPGGTIPESRCRACLSEKTLAYKAKHSEQIRARRRTYYEANHDTIRVRQRDRYHAKKGAA